jgi:Fungal specific transcription factor domain
MSGIRDLKFWSYLVPQMSLSDPLVWNAVLAISSLFEHGSREIRSIDSGDRTSLGPNHRQALAWYNKAIYHFKRHVQLGATDTTTALLSCILFVAIEFSQNSYQNGLALLEKGFKLLSTSLSMAEVDRPLSTSPTIRDIIVPIFSRHAIAMVTFGRPPPREDPRDVNISTIQEPRSHHLSTLSEARTALKTLMHHSYELIRIALLHLRDSDVQADLEVRQRNLRSKYAEWHTELIEMTASQNDESFQPSPMLSSLLVYYGTTLIWLCTCLSPYQTSLDQYIALFRETIDHAAAALISAPNPERMPATEEMDLVPPLYFVASKCREPSLRRKALALLKIAPRKKNAWGGLWNVLPAERIVEKIIELEEIGLCKTESFESGYAGSKLPEEGARIHEIEILLRDNGGRGSRLAIRALRFICYPDGSRHIQEQVLDV